MTYGTPIVATLPRVQDKYLSPGPTFATQYNAVIQEVMDCVEAKVTSAGIKFGSDLAFRNQRATGLSYAAFLDQEEELSRARYPRAFYWIGRDLYINDGRGRTIRLLKDGAVDASSAAGISGSGYGASGVELTWVNASTLYRFKAASASASYAGVRCDALRLNDGSGNYVSLRMAAGLPTSYDIVLPAALPAAGVPGGIYGTKAGTVVTLSHSKTPLHAGNVTFVVTALAGMGSSTPGSTDEVASFGGGTWFIPIPVHVGQRIIDAAVRATLSVNDTVDIIEIDYNDSSDPRYTSIGSVSVTQTSEQTWTVTPTAPGYTALDGKFYGILVTAAAAAVVSRGRATLEWP